MEVETHYDTELTDRQWQITKKLIDSQTAKTTENGGDRSYDAEKAMIANVISSSIRWD